MSEIEQETICILAMTLIHLPVFEVSAPPIFFCGCSGNTKLLEIIGSNYIALKT